MLTCLYVYVYMYMYKYEYERRWRWRKEKGEGRRVKDLLNVISGDVVGVVGCHDGLHLHQVLLHFSHAK